MKITTDRPGVRLGGRVDEPIQAEHVEATVAGIRVGGDDGFVLSRQVDPPQLENLVSVLEAKGLVGFSGGVDAILHHLTTVQKQHPHNVRERELGDAIQALRLALAPMIGPDRTAQIGNATIKDGPFMDRRHVEVEVGAAGQSLTFQAVYPEPGNDAIPHVTVSIGPQGGDWEAFLDVEPSGARATAKTAEQSFGDTVSVERFGEIVREKFPAGRVPDAIKTALAPLFEQISEAGLDDAL
ncbi:MAG: hypothetical protein RIT81_32100 [Deltaproteobacteria bacterium]